jgi:cytochrome c biogenesis protein CcdA
MIKSKRTFSKRMVVVNCILAWAAIFLSIIYAQAAYVAVAGMTLIAALGGIYMGVGHQDLVKILATFGPRAADYTYTPQVTEPARPEDQID